MWGLKRAHMGNIRIRFSVGLMGSLLMCGPVMAQSQKIGDPPEFSNMRLVGFNDLQGRSAYQPTIHRQGDQDHRAPIEVLDAYRGIPSRMKNVEVHIFPGVLHGYMMRGSQKAFHPVTRDFSMTRALAILDGLRGERVLQSLRNGS